MSWSHGEYGDHVRFDPVYVDYFEIMTSSAHGLWVVKRRSTKKYHIVDGVVHPAGGEPDVTPAAFDTEEKAKEVATALARLLDRMYPVPPTPRLSDPFRKLFK